MKLSLAKLVADAAPGSTIVLPRGRHVLDRELRIDKPLTIRGAGPRTVLVGTRGAAVIACGKRAKLKLAQLAVVREGKVPGHVIRCTGGALELASCTVRGGIAKRGSTSIGAGITASGTAKLVLADCVIEDHALVGVIVSKRARLRAVRTICRRAPYGFYITDDTEAILEHNTIDSIATIAVVFLDRARGRARANHCSRCGNAFLVKGKSAPRIEANVCERTTLVGIWVGGHARPVIVKNRVEHAKDTGISIQHRARATITGNHVVAGAAAGIGVLATATATIEGNVITDNKWHGIQIEGSGSVTRNRCERNHWSGIVIGERSAIAATANVCADNGGSGILVLASAHPRIDRCIARGNTNDGLWVGGRAKPTVTGGTFEANTDRGIAIVERAGGRYERNRVHDNEGHGVVVEDKATPRVHANVIRDNGQAGILARDNARPTLSNNVLEGNTDDGIEYWHDAAGTVTGNTCRKNDGSGIRLIGPVSPSVAGNTLVDNDDRGLALDEDTDDVRPRAKVGKNVIRGNAEDPDGGGLGKHAGWTEVARKLRGSPLLAHARRAWRPFTEPGEAALGSKFGGTAYLPPGERWPACGNCDHPMPLIVQLDLARLPKQAGSLGAGLLQLFFCRRDGCSDWGAKAHLARVVAKPRGKPRVAAAPKTEGGFAAKRIASWREHAEVTRWLELAEPARRKLARGLAAAGLSYNDGDDDVGDGPDTSPELGDKLLGWPCWIQDPGEPPYPPCPRCKRAMRNLLQIDSEHGVPWSWGDAGCGWLFQCATHHDELAFDWHCF